jgi:hypothetical protein
MSMPLPLSVVILASSEAGFQGIKKITGLSKPGISPRYFLATLDRPSTQKITHIEDIEHSQVGFWIALDEPSALQCNKVVAALRCNPGYSRGFYDVHLPNPVVKVRNMSELKKLIDEVWEAFCATS